MGCSLYNVVLIVIGRLNPFFIGQITYFL